MCSITSKLKCMRKVHKCEVEIRIGGNFPPTFFAFPYSSKVETVQMSAYHIPSLPNYLPQHLFPSTFIPSGASTGKRSLHSTRTPQSPIESARTRASIQIRIQSLGICIRIRIRIRIRIWRWREIKRKPRGRAGCACGGCSECCVGRVVVCIILIRIWILTLLNLDTVPRYPTPT